MRYLSLGEVVDLHQALVAALAFSLTMNHSFVDGNKRVAMPQWKSSSC